MKVLTWNIWGGKHLDKVTEILQGENADVITLQEVKVQEGKNIAKEIARELGYTVSYCKSFTTDRHTPSYELGNAILTKEKPLSTICHTLSDKTSYQGSPATEPRTAVEVVIPFHNETLTIITTHLGYSDKFGESEIRTIQLEKLLSVIKDKKKLVLTGDFNSLPKSPVTKKLGEVLTNTDQELTQMSFTDYKDATRTRYRIDYMFVSHQLKSKQFVIKESDASDHLPLSVEVSL